MKTINKTEKVVTFKNDPTKVKFFASQAADLISAKRMMETDFEGMGYDPNFDAGVDGFANYLDSTGTRWSDFTDEQIEVIKEIFCL